MNEKGFTLADAISLGIILLKEVSFFYIITFRKDKCPSRAAEISRTTVSVVFEYEEA